MPTWHPKSARQTLTAAYASEVCPLVLRHYLTAYINMCWGISIFLSSGVVRASLAINSDWGWRLPFVIQWIWPVPLMIGTYFAPESPWWLVRQGRHEDAEESVMRLTDPNFFSKEDAKRSVANMIHTTAIEREMQAGTSYGQCFSGIDLRRTEIAMMVFAMQLLSGENLVGQGVQLCVIPPLIALQPTPAPIHSFKQAGLGTRLTRFVFQMFIIDTVTSWFLLSRFGRRTLYLSGLATMATFLLVIGTLGFSHADDAQWVVGGLLVVLSFVYNAALGAVCYVIIAEAMNIICGIITPLMLSPTSWNWGPKSGFFWFGSAALSTLYYWFRLPETMDRSYGELHILYENKVPAWRFRKTKVDQFGIPDATSPMDEKISHDSKQD
ncbi:hypothetical protein K438DRAFT_1976593 [Mycena galopus ATCC 62051]|nr:hypothetical protein K438DRAFT_1976593 [Mycena galopus ATCC 62051]